jgi:hypothetical protein
VKNRLALLLFLIVCFSLSLMDLRSRPIHTGTQSPVGPDSLLPGNYWNRTRTSRFSLYATVLVDGTLSMFLYDYPGGIISELPIQGLVTNVASGRIRADFGDAGYFKGWPQPSHQKIVGRLILRSGGKVIVRRCVLNRIEPSDGVVIVIDVARPADSMLGATYMTISSAPGRHKCSNSGKSVYGRAVR